LGWWWLRWIEMEVMRMSGGEVLTWRCWIWRRRCV
jgi:hypothetical protein